MQNRCQTSADDEDLIEHVGSKQLDIMISTVDHLLVLYHDERKGYYLLIIVDTSTVHFSLLKYVQNYIS